MKSELIVYTQNLCQEPAHRGRFSSLTDCACHCRVGRQGANRSCTGVVNRTTTLHRSYRSWRRVTLMDFTNWRWGSVYQSSRKRPRKGKTRTGPPTPQPPPGIPSRVIPSPLQASTQQRWVVVELCQLAIQVENPFQAWHLLFQGNFFKCKMHIITGGFQAFESWQTTG